MAVFRVDKRAMAPLCSRHREDAGVGSAVAAWTSGHRLVGRRERYHLLLDPGEEMVGVYSTQAWGTGAVSMLGGFLGAEFQGLAYQGVTD
jgi:hypothetical protein